MSSEVSELADLLSRGCPTDGLVRPLGGLASGSLFARLLDSLGIFVTVKCSYDYPQDYMETTSSPVFTRLSFPLLMQQYVKAIYCVLGCMFSLQAS
jgi:hypothetical protein